MKYRAVFLYCFGLICCVLILTATSTSATEAPVSTVYTLPKDIRWIPDTTKGVPRGSSYANLRGKDSDKCGQLVRVKFSDGFVYPWHVNHAYSIYTVLKGTLIVGFDRTHRKSAERALPAGSIMQGLRTEPHYGRAVGETVFDVYTPCNEP